jgi:hypothetical protein
VDKQIDELITEFMRNVQRVVGSAQTINVTVNLYNTNRLDWNVTVQQAGEDRVGMSRNKAFNAQQ